jgi:pilus assembly protein CpaE
MHNDMHPNEHNDRHNSDGLTVALLTVQVGAETAKLMRSAASHLPWTLVPVDYDHYFSTARIPALTQRAIEAQCCIAVVDFDRDPELALATAEYLRQSFFHKIAILAGRHARGV